MMHRWSACWLLIFFLWAFGGNLWAQQPAQADRADEPAGRRIYVPIEDLDAVIDHDKQGVLLPRAEFLKLAADAQKQTDVIPNSPHGIVVSHAEYAARIHDDQLVISATIELNQLARGWQTVTLPYRGLALEAASLDDKPAAIGRGAAEERPLVIFLQHAGKHTLKLQLSIPLVAVGSDRVAAFGLAPISSATLQIAVPAKKNLHVNEVALDRPAAADQPADYVTAVGGMSSISLRITDQRAQLESTSLVFAGTAIGLHVAPEERTWRAVTSLNIYGKPIDNLTFVVPRSLEIVSVESTGLERWEIVPGERNTTALKLVYRQPFSEARTATFAGVSASVPGQPWSVPTLLLKGATSHLVRVLVQHPPGLRLQQVEATGVRRVPPDESSDPDMPGSPEMAVKVTAGQRLHYAAWREDFSLLFVTQPRARELQATIATRIDIDSRELVLHSSIVVQTRYAPLFDFDLALPVDWLVSEVLAENRPVRWRAVPVAAGLNQVRLTFHPPIPADGKVNLTLAARLIPGENWPVEETPLSFKLPEVSLPEVGVTDGRYLIAADDDLDLVPEDVRGLDPARLSAEEQRTAGAVRLAFEYQDTRLGGTLKVSRKPLRVAAQTLAFHRLDRETLVSHLEARLVVQGGGLEKLQLALPESAGTNLRFSLVDPPGGTPVRRPQITEQTSAAPADGERVWTLSLDQRAFGLVWLVVDLTEKRAADANSINLPGLRVLAAERQSGFAAVEAGADQQLEVTATDAAGQPLVEMDSADIPVPLGYVPQERIVAAYRAVRPGFRLSVKETRFDREPVPTAVCDKAILTSVLGESGQQQHKAEFVLRAVGVQGLRVELPVAGRASLWAALIDGRPIEIRVLPATNGSPAWMIPLPTVAGPGQARHLQLFYRTDGPSLESSGTLHEPPPRIKAVNGQGDEQPIEILDREWTLYHPSQTEITASTGQFEPVQRPVRESLLGRLHERLSSVSPTELGQKGLVAVIAAAAIGLFFFAWRRRGIAGAAATALVGLLMLAALTFFTFSNQEHSSAKYDADSTDFWSLNKGIVQYNEHAPERTTAAEGRASPAKPRAMGGAEFKGPAGAMPAPTVPADAAIEPEAEVDRRSPLKSGVVKDRALHSLPRSDIRDGVSNTFGQPLPPQFEQPLIAGSGVELDQFGRPAVPGGNPNVKRRAPMMQDGSVAFLQGQFDDAAEAARDAAAGAEPVGKPAARGALLSLAIDLPTMPESRTTSFRYFGAPAADSNPALDVGYQNRRTLSFVALAWQAGMLLVFWFARRWSTAARAMLAVLGVVTPVALVSLVPIDVLPHLDGIFLGSLWGLALWTLIAIVTSPRRIAQALRADVFRQSPGLLIALTIACGFANCGAYAQDAKLQAPAGSQVDEVRRTAPTIVVPYELTEDPLHAPRVFLPWDRFLELWNAAHPDEVDKAPAPRDGLIAEALYSVEASPAAPARKPSAEVTSRFVLYSFRDDQISLALPLGRVALTRSQLDGKSAALVSRDTPSGFELTAVLPTRGVHVLDLTFTIPLEQAGPAGKLVLPLRPVAAGSLRFTLPAADVNLRVSGAAGAFRKVREGEKTLAVVPVDRGGDVTLAWAPAQAREAAQAIVHVESATAIHLGDAGLRLSSRFKYTVRQGAISDVSYALPAGLLVRQIAGLDLGGWEIAGDGADRTLKVFLRRPVNDATTIQFDLFMAGQFTDQPQSLAVAQLVPQNVTRETGTLGVYSERSLAVTAAGASGLVQIDAGQFDAPGPLAAPGAPAAPTGAPAQPLFAYRFPARPVQLQLLVSRQKPQSKAVAEHAVVVGARKLRMASRLELHLAGAPRSELAVQLPPGYLLYDLKASEPIDYHVETRPGEPGAGQAPLLIIEFEGPRTGDLELVLDGIISRAPEEMAQKVAVPAPLGIGELRSSLAVWLDRIYTATLEDYSGWKSVDPGELSARLRAAQNAPVQFAFTSTLTSLQPVALALTRAVPRLSADALAVVIARDTSVQYLLYLRWNIAAAGESAFVFTTPDWLADRLEFDSQVTGLRLRQVRSEKIAGNRLRWTVTLDDPRTSVATLLAQATLPPPEAQRVVAPQITFEQETAGNNGRQFQPLEVQHHFIVLVNQASQRLEPETRDAVEPLPADDLPIKISRAISDEAAEILRLRDPRASVAWRIQAARPIKSLPASVNLAKMTLVIARDGSWRAEADYRIHNRSRQFLALRMPSGSRILSLFVAGHPSRPIDPKRADEHNLVLVPLPKTSAGDLAADVKLVFAGRFDRPLPNGVHVLRSDFDLPAPHVVSQGEFGIPVAATEWTVILPPNIDARRVDDASRSNVAESEAGVEDLIARQNEWLNLFAVVVDDSESIAAKDRAMNNLKRLGLAIHTYGEAERLLNETPADNRQISQWRELESKRREAEQQLQQQPAQKLAGGGRAGKEVLSNRSVQRELIAANTVDFAVDRPLDEAESLPQIKIETPVSQPAATAPAKASEEKAAGKSARSNRSELRQQTQSQSEQLNSALGAKVDGDQTANFTRNGKSAAGAKGEVQNLDADEVLDLSTAGAADFKKGDRSKALPQGGAGGAGQWPRYGAIAGLAPAEEPVTGLGAPAGGGAGGGAGPIGRPEMADGQAVAETPGWSSVGGLSLKIDVPQEGQKLTFSKSGGDARLALGLRPRESLEAGFGLIWTALWLIAGVLMIAALSRANARSALARRLPPIAAGLGLAWYVLLPAAPIGFALFVLGCASFGWQHRRG